MRLVDSHCHLHFAPLAADIEGEMAAMAAANVDAALVVATTAAEVETVVALARQWPALFAAVGIHPLKESGEAEADAAQIARWAADPKAVAIGETGLDFSRGRGDEAEQKNRFLAHIEAAKIVAKPLVIHTRESLTETLDILRARKRGRDRRRVALFRRRLGRRAARARFGLSHFFHGHRQFQKRRADARGRGARSGGSIYGRNRRAVFGAGAAPRQALPPGVDARSRAGDGDGARRDNRKSRARHNPQLLRIVRRVSALISAVR